MATRKRKTHSGLTPAKHRLLRSLKVSRGQNLSMMANSYLIGIRLIYLRGTGDQFTESSLALYDPHHVNRIKFSVAFKLFDKMDGFFDDVKQGLIDPSVKDVNEHLREYEDAVNHLVRLRKLLHFCHHAVRFFPKLEQTKQIISKYEVNDLPEKDE